jgi:hypothetical protein
MLLLQGRILGKLVQKISVTLSYGVDRETDIGEVSPRVLWFGSVSCQRSAIFHPGMDSWPLDVAAVE